MPVTPARRQSQFTEVVQGPRASAADFGAAEAGAIQELGGVVGQLGQQAYQQARKQDTFVAQQAYNKSVEVAQNLSAEASKLRGNNAIGAATKAGKNLDLEVEKLTKGMSGRQKKMFDKNWNFRRNGYISGIDKHEGDQTRLAFVSEKNTLQKAGAADYKGTGVQAHFDASQAAISEVARLNGATSKEETQLLENNAESMQGGWFDSLINSKRYDEARAQVDNLSDSRKPFANQQLDQLQLQELQLTTKAAKAAYGNTGSYASLQDGRDAVIEFHEKNKSSDAEKALALEAYDESAHDTRFNSMRAAGDTTGAEAYAQTMTGDKREIALKQVENDVHAEKKLLERQAHDRMVEGTQRSMEYARDLQPDDPATAFAPLDKSIEFFGGNVEQGTAYFNERQVAVNRIIKDRDDAQKVLTANSDEHRSASVLAAYDALTLVTLGDMSFADGQLLLDDMALNTDSASKTATTKLSEALANASSGKTDGSAAQRAFIIAREAKAFNKANGKAKPFFGQLVPGDLEVKDGEYKPAYSESDVMFSSLLQSWDQALSQAASDKKSALTPTEINTLADGHFGPVRQWNSRVTFADNVRQVTRESLANVGEAYGANPSVNTEAHAVMTQLLESVKATGAINATTTNAIK